MIWKNMITTEQLNSLSKNTILEHLDLQFTKIGPDYIEATMPVDHRTVQPAGLFHGGASCVLAETLGSMASVLLVDGFKTASIVGIEINANHLKSVRKGKVYGKASPIKIGRRLHIWNIEIRDNENNLCCVSRLTCMVSAL
jgi:1,4-dihydroxy-2-naphthoyl-CoA hydrolase